ncbi:MAG: 16S rRNA (adenine(1518)-N(6)/adenine(1519)-N(6))-dimethyltransferase RsmA, partial [Chloroflexi bacterium]|nr:16S rRNA (adenine(1518)-N(6)/adenine(1519)-N(6))-dimethyltransferase RsmA [Chloroflexota bacterium]
QPRVPERELPRFFRIAQAGFGQKRKQLHNSLVHNLHLPTEIVRQALEASGIAPERRPQTLSIAEWAALARALPTAPPAH